MLPLPSSFQIARSLSKEHYALVFGINTFAASVLQTLLTAVVLNTKSLQLTVATQVSYISTIQACPMFGSTLINTPAALLFQRLLWLHSGSLLHHVAAMYHDCDFFLLQYFIYATYFGAIALIFLIRGVYSVHATKHSQLEGDGQEDLTAERQTGLPESSQV